MILFFDGSKVSKWSLITYFMNRIPELFLEFYSESDCVKTWLPDSKMVFGNSKERIVVLSDEDFARKHGFRETQSKIQARNAVALYFSDENDKIERFYENKDKIKQIAIQLGGIVFADNKKVVEAYNGIFRAKPADQLKSIFMLKSIVSRQKFRIEQNEFAVSAATI